MVALAGVRIVPGTAQKAAAAVARLLGSRAARLVSPFGQGQGTDVVQVFTADGVYLNRKLLAVGSAAFCRQTAVVDEAAELQAVATEAHSKRLGVWQGGGER